MPRKGYSIWSFVSVAASAATFLANEVHKPVMCSPVRVQVLNDDKLPAFNPIVGDVNFKVTAYMAAEPDTCTIFLSHKAQSDRLGTPPQRILYCVGIFHEEGHLAGLPHDETGKTFMSSALDGEIPQPCLDRSRTSKSS